MLVSTKGRYGLRMMIDIARNSGEDGQTRVSLREIGHRQGISAKYLEQLARLLCRGGLLLGSRGQGGGYVLGKEASEIRVGDILRAAEGSLAPVACLARTDAVCARRETCEVLGFWEGLDRVIANYVDSLTLAEMVARIESPAVVAGPCLANVAPSVPAELELEFGSPGAREDRPEE